MLPEAAGRGQHFQVQGHNFSLYGPTVSRQITYLLFSCDKLAYNWVYTCNFVIELVYVPSTNHRKKSNELTNERVTQTLHKERCIKEQIYFELLYVSSI